jgi:hypothetical protein
MGKKEEREEQEVKRRPTAARRSLHRQREQSRAEQGISGCAWSSSFSLHVWRLGSAL